MNEPAPYARARTHAAPVSPHPLPHRVSEIFDPAHWREIDGFTHRTSASRNLPGNLTDVTYHRGCVRSADGAWVRDLPVVRIALNRPEVRNAFRPRTVDELYRTLDHARMSGDVGAVILTGNGPSPRDGGWAFSSGGDQRIRGRDGYHYERDDGPTNGTAARDDVGSTNAATPARLEEPTDHAGAPSPAAADTAPESAPAAHDHAHDHAVDVAAAQARVDTARAGRLHILEVQRLIRTMPKVVIAAVPGWAAGGGHSLNVVCDLSLASLEHARFKQTDADVGSFDAGYGSALLARQVGDKRARDLHLGGVGAGSSHEDAGRGRGDLGNGHVDGDAVSIPGQPGRSRQGPLEPGGEPRDGGVEVVVPEGGDLPPSGAAVQQNAVAARDAAEAGGHLDVPHDGAIDAVEEPGGVLGPQGVQVELAAHAERRVDDLVLAGHITQDNRMSAGPCPPSGCRSRSLCGTIVTTTSAGGGEGRVPVRRARQLSRSRP